MKPAPGDRRQYRFARQELTASGFSLAAAVLDTAR
jgi:hypothetical protein